MVSARQILRSFVYDALRLCSQATDCLRECEGEFAASGATTPERVRRLFQIVHTLKGTATMIPGTKALTVALQELEGRLATRSLDQSARDRSWLALADDALVRARVALTELQRKEESARRASAPDSSARGVLASLGDGRMLWFPLSAVTRVLSPNEILGHSVLSHEGAWVPLWRPAKLARAFGLGVRTQEGALVIAVAEVLGICVWSEASRKGARPGLEAVLTEAKAA